MCSARFRFSWVRGGADGALYRWSIDTRATGLVALSALLLSARLASNDYSSGLLEADTPKECRLAVPDEVDGRGGNKIWNYELADAPLGCLSNRKPLLNGNEIQKRYEQRTNREMGMVVSLFSAKMQFKSRCAQYTRHDLGFKWNRITSWWW